MRPAQHRHDVPGQAQCALARVGLGAARPQQTLTRHPDDLVFHLDGRRIQVHLVPAHRQCLPDPQPGTEQPRGEVRQVFDRRLRSAASRASRSMRSASVSARRLSRDAAGLPGGVGRHRVMEHGQTEHPEATDLYVHAVDAPLRRRTSRRRTLATCAPGGPEGVEFTMELSNPLAAIMGTTPSSGQRWCT